MNEEERRTRWRDLPPDLRDEIVNTVVDSKHGDVSMNVVALISVVAYDTIKLRPLRQVGWASSSVLDPLNKRPLQARVHSLDEFICSHNGHEDCIALYVDVPDRVDD